jgi:hypothetical protein
MREHNECTQAVLDAALTGADPRRASAALLLLFLTADDAAVDDGAAAAPLTNGSSLQDTG